MLNLINPSSQSGSHWAFLDQFDDYYMVAPGHARITEGSAPTVPESMPLNLQADFHLAPRGRFYSYNKDANRRKTDEAIRHWSLAHGYSRTHVQRWLFSFLICDFDPGCDVAGAARLMCEDGLQPHRVLSCMNTNGVQTWHRMAVPVSWKNEKRRGLMREACAFMATRYGADPHYRNGCVAGYSPFSSQMWNLEIEDGAGDRAYELEKVVELMRGVVTEEVQASAEMEIRKRRGKVGRNHDLFSTLRSTVMAKVHEFEDEKEFRDWCFMAADQAHIALTANNPLPRSEVRGVAKSVSAWVWYRRARFQNNPASHYVRGVARGLMNAIATDKRAHVAQTLHRAGETIESISSNMEAGVSTVYRLLHRVLDERGRSVQTKEMSRRMTALQQGSQYRELQTGKFNHSIPLWELF